MPIIVVCTKSDLIDDNYGFVGAVALRGWYQYDQGKGCGEGERHRWGHGDATHGATVRLLIFMTVNSSYLSLTDSTGLFSTAPQPTPRNVLRPYALHVLFVPPAPAPGGVSDGTAAPVHDLHFRCSTFQTLSIVTELSFRRGKLWQDRGPTIRLRCESVRGVEARSLVRVWC